MFFVLTGFAAVLFCFDGALRQKQGSLQKQLHLNYNGKWQGVGWLIATRESRRGINLEIEINIDTLLSVKQINSKDLVYSTGSYTQYLIITYNGRGY